MSQTPGSSEDSDAVANYRAGWLATMKLLRAGQSFSGRERNCAFLNCGSGPFANVSAVSGLDFPDDGRAIGLTDWDQDGDLDLWFANRTGPRLRLMRNETISDRDDEQNANFVALSLQGVRANRDAIGARVEISLNDSAPIIQTLRAGDAYLSQSSKWLHFGLGPVSQIQQVVVRWPGGAAETFSGIEPGHRYRLVEGSGEARDVTTQRRALALKASFQPAAESDPNQRLVLGTRLPIPILRYTPLDRLEARVVESRQRPLLVVLWASWCPSCLAELAALESDRAALERSGVDVLALSLDNLDQSRPADAQASQRTLDRLQFGFPAGHASREMLDKLEVIQTLLFNRQPPTAVPTSYLLDAEGRLAAIYQGPVSRTQLLTDINILSLPPRERRDAAIPFAGRWSSPHREVLLSAVGRFFDRAGYREDYVRYLDLEARGMALTQDESAGDPTAGGSRQRHAAAHFNLGVELASSGDVPEAIEHFQRTVAADPEHFEAMINLGALLARTRQIDAAIEVLTRAVAQDPTSLPAHTNLAAALEAHGRFAEAAEHYRAALELQPELVELRARLGRALTEEGEFAAATRQFEQVIGQSPDDVRATLCLAWLKATCPEAAIRNGDQAVQLAQRLATLRNPADPLVMDILAAAYAEAGDFATAVTIAGRLLEQMGAKETPFKSLVRTRLEAYRQRQAHQDADGKYP